MCIKVTQSEIDDAFIFACALKDIVKDLFTEEQFMELEKRSEISVSKFNDNFHVIFNLIAKNSKS